ncbi:MAG: T9SS C-terminal target domain-containing protein [Ignavibacteriae bacterium]|nr:MAG: T9SS C-terminal target domain-containing protein [Ignavibacteriota bacterium]
MKKYILSLVLIIAIAAIALSFRSNSGKFGPRLTNMLDNSPNNHFVVYVFLSDKGPDAFNLLSKPLELVTQRSIDRRLKVKSPNDVVDMTDLPVYNEYLKEIASSSLKVRHQIKWFNALSVEVNRDQLEEISSKSFVSQIELVETKMVKKEDLVVDNSIENNSNDNDDLLVDTLNYGTGSALTQITQINVNLVHNQGIFGQGVMIASFDAGFSNLTHEAFTTAPMNIKTKWDFHTNSPNLTGHSHGTATLSLVGGYKPGQMIGPAFKSTFILARTEVDPGEVPLEMDHWVAAAQWADSLGADVITSSLGYLEFDPPYPTYTWNDMNGNTLIITKAADLAVNKGIVVSNSAGNNGSSSTHNTLGAPADGDSVITVGAVTSTGTRASFSSVGPTTDNPPRIKPDVMAMGSNNRVAGTSGNTYYNGDGTSFSCPLNSGVCALILSANKSLTPLQVRGILRKFASNNASPNNTMGWGIINANLSVDSARKLDAAPPVILHTQPFTNTTSTGIITMKAKITDNGIIRNWTNEAPRLYFRKSTNNGSTWTSYSTATASSTNLDTFFFPITASTIGTRVEYYIAAQDIALPTPKMATLPVGGSGVTPPGSTAPSTRFAFNVVATGITGNYSEIPSVFMLYDNYPNPFNPTTNIKFDLPKSTFVKLVVYDLLGREIETLVNTDLTAASYVVDFDASKYSSGIYFYRIETSAFTDVKKMMLVK